MILCVGYVGGFTDVFTFALIGRGAVMSELLIDHSSQSFYGVNLSLALIIQKVDKRHTTHAIRFVSYLPNFGAFLRVPWLSDKTQGRS